MQDPQLAWFTSSYSQPSGDCVQVALTPEAVLVRDSKDQPGPVLRIPAAEWKSFTARAQDGLFG